MSFSKLKTSMAQVRQRVECGVCFDMMQAPIYICQTGHSLCNKCSERLGTCPICQLPFTTIRNLALEGIVDVVLVPCQFTNCEEQLKIREMATHVSKCDQRSFHCLVDPQCVWTGSRGECLGHVESEHTNKIIFYNSCANSATIWFSNFSLANSNVSTYIIPVKNETFFLRYYVDDLKRLFITVHYLGQADLANKFQYTVTITADEADHDRKIESNAFPDHSDIVNLATEGSIEHLTEEEVAGIRGENELIVLLKIKPKDENSSFWEYVKGFIQLGWYIVAYTLGLYYLSFYWFCVIKDCFRFCDDVPVLKNLLPVFVFVLFFVLYVLFFQQT